MRQATHVPPAPEIRPLTPADADAVADLDTEAFGYPAAAGPAAAKWPPVGSRAWGVLRGRDVVAAAEVRELASWFGGTAVPTAGIAAVAVRPEHRGARLLVPLFREMLADARARGEVISTLFPTAPGIYRPLGYEIVGELTDVEVPVASLARIPAPDGIVLRRADPDDEHDVVVRRAVYDRWAVAQNGALTRQGPQHRPLGREAPDDWDTVTLAFDTAGEPVGYAAWRRTDGYQGGTATVTVHELIALTGAAAAALWRLFGGFASVAGTVALRTSGADPTRLVLPAAPWRPVRQWPYGLRLLDVVGAFRARGAAPIDATLPFRVIGDGLDGTYRLTASGGALSCEPAAADGPAFTGRGLALAYAGVQSCANLRFVGLLSGPDTDDARWDALLGGGFAIRNYF